MRPGIWSYVFGGVGLLAFLGTAGLYAGATEFLPLWGLAILWAAWAALLVFAIWLMRMSPAWVLAVPVLSVILLAMLTGDPRGRAAFPALSLREAVQSKRSLSQCSFFFGRCPWL